MFILDIFLCILESQLTIAIVAFVYGVCHLMTSSKYYYIDFLDFPTITILKCVGYGVFYAFIALVISALLSPLLRSVLAIGIIFSTYKRYIKWTEL